MQFGTVDEWRALTSQSNLGACLHTFPFSLHVSIFGNRKQGHDMHLIWFLGTAGFFFVLCRLHTTIFLIKHNNLTIRTYSVVATVYSKSLTWQFFHASSSKKSLYSSNKKKCLALVGYFGVCVGLGGGEAGGRRRGQEDELEPKKKGRQDFIQFFLLFLLW